MSETTWTVTPRATRTDLESAPRKELVRLAGFGGMRYRWESSKSEIVNYLLTDTRWRWQIRVDTYQPSRPGDPRRSRRDEQGQLRCDVLTDTGICERLLSDHDHDEQGKA